MMEHLNETTREVANRSVTERMAFIRGYKWIGYSRAVDVMGELETLLELPRTSRMPSILIYGSSNNGKTAIIERFSDKYPMVMNENNDLKRKVLLVYCPPLADEKRLYQQILRSLVVPFRTNHGAEILFDQVVRAFKSLELKVLIIDEIHHLYRGNKDKRQVFLNAIKLLSNQLGISIVAAGTEDAFHVFQSDRQISSRFEPMELPKWKLDKEYILFLNSYEKILPLREKSNLYERELAIKIYSLTDHTIGGVCDVLKKSAIHAIKTGQEKITLDVIADSGILHPDERRKVLPQ